MLGDLLIAFWDDNTNRNVYYYDNDDNHDSYDNAPLFPIWRTFRLRWNHRRMRRYAIRRLSPVLKIVHLLVFAHRLKPVFNDSLLAFKDSSMPN